jgi:hypothetical protein
VSSHARGERSAAKGASFHKLDTLPASPLMSSRWRWVGAVVWLRRGIPCGRRSPRVRQETGASRRRRAVASGRVIVSGATARGGAASTAITPDEDAERDRQRRRIAPRLRNVARRCGRAALIIERPCIEAPGARPSGLCRRSAAASSARTGHRPRPSTRRAAAPAGARSRPATRQAQRCGVPRGPAR